MRIGEFAKLFGLNKSAIRYYTENHLLLPVTTGTYPEYDNRCITDMKDILKLKAMGFSIDEIQKIKAKERLYVDLSGKHEDILNVILDKKIENIQHEIDELHGQIDMIKAYRTRDQDDPHPLSYGLPFEALDFLQCPYCHETFNIESASIVNQRIESGFLRCSCGEHFKVLGGIVYPTADDALIKPRTFEQLQLNDKINNEHFAQLQEAGKYILDILTQWDHHKGIVHINSDSDIFSMNLPSGFRQDGVYFFCSYESTVLEQLRSKMATKDIPGKIIYICYGDRVPIKADMHYFIDNAGHALDTIMEKAPSGLQSFIKIMADHAECAAIHLKPTRESEQASSQKYINQFADLSFTIAGQSKIGILKELGQVFETETLSNDLEFLGYHFKR